MAFNIANFFEADRRSARAGETMSQGMIVKVSNFGSGERKLMKVGNSDSALLVSGNYAVVCKFSTDPGQVNTSTAPSRLGSRITTISSGDHVVEVRRGAIMEYSADLLDASLDPARSGTTPAVGDALEIVGSLWCKVGTGSAITSPIIGRVFRVFGTQVLVELL